MCVFFPPTAKLSTRCSRPSWCSLRCTSSQGSSTTERLLPMILRFKCCLFDVIGPRRQGTASSPYSTAWLLPSACPWWPQVNPHWTPKVQRKALIIFDKNVFLFVRKARILESTPNSLRRFFCGLHAHRSSPSRLVGVLSHVRTCVVWTRVVLRHLDARCDRMRKKINSNFIRGAFIHSYFTPLEGKMAVWPSWIWTKRNGATPWIGWQTIAGYKRTNSNYPNISLCTFAGQNHTWAVSHVPFHHSGIHFERR